MTRVCGLILLIFLRLPLANADTVSSLNIFFTDEWGPTPFNSAGHPDGYADCGPASLLMAVTYLGLLEPFTSATAESDIRNVRNLTRGQPTPMSGPTYAPMMIQGGTALGAKVMSIKASSASVLAAIHAGALVLLAGDPRTSWGFQLDLQKKYLHHYGAPGPIPPPTNGLSDVDHFGHWVIAFGISPTNQIYIGDPLSTIGVIEVTASAIDQYFAEWPIMTGALAISK